MSKRKSNEDRSKEFAEIGARLAAKHGAENVTRRMVAEKAKVPESLVSHHVGGTAEAQKLYKATAKKLGLAMPDKATVAKEAEKLRKARNAKKAAKTAATKAQAGAAKKPAKAAKVAPSRKPASARGASPRKSTAGRLPAPSKAALPLKRKPKAPPALPLPGDQRPLPLPGEE